MVEKRSISRRDFLKGAGMTGATLGVVGSGALTLAGEFIVEETAGGIHNRPWWVREVDKPTTDINWTDMQRFDAHLGPVRGPGWTRHVGRQEATRLAKVAAENERRRLLEEAPGYTLKDQALRSAFGSIRSLLPTSFLGPQRAATPEERGVPRWTGSPEETAKTVKAALRHMGAASVGIVHLNERTRKLIYAVDPDGKRLEFEDVEMAYEDDEKRVIPYRAEWVIVYTVQMSQETLKRAPTAIAAQTTGLTYNRGASIQMTLQEFLRGLGYQGLGEATVNALGIAPALGVLGGLGELSRQNRLITPEYGPMVRVFKLVTDLPMATDRPIDAGIVKFCPRCKKCAEACPPGALSFDTHPTWQTVGPWNNPGHKAWFEDSVKCMTYWQQEAGTNCGICFAVCPFSKKDKSFMHDFIKMYIARAPALDGIIRSLDDAFGYGEQKDPAAWWDLDLPEYGIDTRQGKRA